MRAACVEELGRPPTPRDVSEPAAEPGRALIKVLAAPLNPIDIAIGAGRFYAGAPELPYVAGKEGVGEVIASDSRPAGDRVYFTLPGGLGGAQGSLAERVAVDEPELTPVPGGADEALAACFGIAGLAAWLPLEWRARLRAGESVLVLGASGAVGQVAVQAAKLLGAGRVVAAARDEVGLARARELGADASVRLAGNGGAEELAAAFEDAAGGPIDVTVDPLWGESAVAAAHAAAKGGRLVQIGQSASAEATIPSAVVRGKLLSLLGHTSGAAPREVRTSAYLRMVGHAVAGRLTVDHDVVPLDRVADAWERQAASPHRKLVLRP